MTAPSTATAMGAVERACERSDGVDELFAAVSDILAKAVPFDASMWFSVDPVTLLATAPARVQNMAEEYCTPFWHGEFHDTDLAQWRDLAREPVPATSLRLASNGRLLRSPRFRDFMRPQGWRDEARVVFRTGTTTWAVAGLYRDGGRADFTPHEVQFLADISRTVGVALRARTLATPPAGRFVEPGVLMFAPDATLISANAEAREWLCRIFGAREDDCQHWTRMLSTSLTSPETMHNPALPALVYRAQAVAAGLDEGPARLRLRDKDGRWIVLHASCLADGDHPGPVVVVVEPAKSAELAPIIVEAYGLSPREREVVRGLARGLGTPEIAAQLYLSAHTVRDYVKSVFEKVGVSSRGELVATLFADHYVDAMHEQLVHVE